MSGLLEWLRTTLQHYRHNRCGRHNLVSMCIMCQSKPRTQGPFIELREPGYEAKVENEVYFK